MQLPNIDKVIAEVGKDENEEAMQRLIAELFVELFNHLMERGVHAESVHAGLINALLQTTAQIAIRKAGCDCEDCALKLFTEATDKIRQMMNANFLSYRKAYLKAAAELNGGTKQ